MNLLLAAETSDVAAGAAEAVNELGAIPIAVLAAYLVLLLFLGWLGYVKSRGGEEDYYLAGRGQGWLISALTIIATFMSSFALMGAPGMVYREGVVFALVSLNAPVAGFCIFVLGNRIRKIGKARGYVTQADMICEHYGSPVVLRLLVVTAGLLFVIPYVMMQIKAGGVLAAVLFRDYEQAFNVGACVLAAITAVYIMVGGMRSVAWTDAVQCVLLLGGMVLSGIAVVVAFGGPAALSEAVAKLPAKSLTVPGNTGLWKWPFLLSVCLLMPVGAMLQPAQWMRFYAAKDSQTLRRGALIFIIVLAGAYLFGIMPIGLAGQALYPLEQTETGVKAPAAVGSFDQIMVVVLKDQLPKLFGAPTGLTLTTLFVVAIMAASMSTADSNLHALSAVVTRDIYDRFIRPRASQRERVWVGQIAILASTVAALIFVLVGSRAGSSLAGFMEMIVSLALVAVAFSIQLLPMTVDMLYVRRGNRWGAIAGTAVGLAAAFLFSTLFDPLAAAFPESGLTVVKEYVDRCKAVVPMHASAWGVIPNAAVFVVVSFITGGMKTRKDNGGSTA